MRKIIATLAVLAAVAGCRSAGTDTSPATAASSSATGHAQMVASLGNSYMWNCRLQSKWGNPDWQFVLQRVGRDKFSVVVREAGRRQPRPIENLREDNAARVYFLRDGSRILELQRRTHKQLVVYNVEEPLNRALANVVSALLRG